MAKKVTKSAPKKHEGQTSRTSKAVIKAAQVVAVEVVEELIEDDIVDATEFSDPKLFEGKKMYWAKTMHFFKVGVVSGIITKYHWGLFMEKAPSDIDIFKWISSVDKDALRLAEAKRKMKAKLGIK